MESDDSITPQASLSLPQLESKLPTSLFPAHSVFHTLRFEVSAYTLALKPPSPLVQRLGLPSETAGRGMDGVFWSSIHQLNEAITYCENLSLSLQHRAIGGNSISRKEDFSKVGASTGKALRFP